jgi:hypothetical protein
MTRRIWQKYWEKFTQCSSEMCDARHFVIFRYFLVLVTLIPDLIILNEALWHFQKKVENNLYFVFDIFANFIPFILQPTAAVLVMVNSGSKFNTTDVQSKPMLNVRLPLVSTRFTLPLMDQENTWSGSTSMESKLKVSFHEKFSAVLKSGFWFAFWRQFGL